MAVMQQPDLSLLRGGPAPFEMGGGQPGGPTSRGGQNSPTLSPISQVTGKEGWAPNWQSSIPSAYQANQYIRNNQQAQSQGFRNFSEQDAYGNLQNIIGSLQRGITNPMGGDVGAMQQQLAMRQNQLANFGQGSPGQMQGQLPQQATGQSSTGQVAQVQQQGQQQQMLAQLLRALMQRGQMGGGQQQTGGGIGQGYQQWQQPSAYGYGGYSMPQQNGYYTGGYAPGYQQYQQQQGYNMSSPYGSQMGGQQGGQQQLMQFLQALMGQQQIA